MENSNDMADCMLRITHICINMKRNKLILNKIHRNQLRVVGVMIFFLSGAKKNYQDFGIYIWFLNFAVYTA